MKKNNKFLVGLILISTIFSSCKDQFANINTDPEKTPPTIEYLFTGGLTEMNAQDYYSWFWNYNAVLPWLQYTASGGGNTEQLAYMNDLFEDYEHLIDVKRQAEGVKHLRSTMTPEDAAVYAHVEAMCAPMVIYMGLRATDGSGSIPYSEAAKAYFVGEEGFLPKFDSQKELMTTWLAELKESIEVLGNEVKGADGQPVSQFMLGKQDFVYNGNSEKWLKFANSLRLKIAVRLLHQDRAWAEDVVADVMKYPLIMTNDDDFIWSPGARWRNSPNNFQTSPGSKHVIEFLVNNKDPRVRFIFTKNQFNEEIINGFLAEGKSLPSFINQYVETKTDADGKKVFDKFKAPGEPWVRYHGVPIDLKSKEYQLNMDDYYTVAKRELGSGETKKSYVPSSTINETMLKGEFSYAYPALPGKSPIEYKKDGNVTFNYMSAGEVNLYLAELKVLGFSSITGSAETYFQNGVRYSVKMYDDLASRNRIPYYEKTTGLPESDLPIALKEGEIDELLTQPAYVLDGSRNEKLEKIYVQMFFHFGLNPNDLFSIVRRTGIPMKGSNIFPAAEWDSKTKKDLTLPRRYQIRSLTSTDELMEMREKAYNEQGFSPGKNDPVTLNKERLWYDKGAPQYGEGPNY